MTAPTSAALKAAEKLIDALDIVESMSAATLIRLVLTGGESPDALAGIASGQEKTIFGATPVSGYDDSLAEIDPRHQRERLNALAAPSRAPAAEVEALPGKDAGILGMLIANAEDSKPVGKWLLRAPDGDEIEVSHEFVKALQFANDPATATAARDEIMKRLREWPLCGPPGVEFGIGGNYSFEEWCEEFFYGPMHAAVSLALGLGQG